MRPSTSPLPFVIGTALLFGGCDRGPPCLSATEKARRVSEARDQLAQMQANEATVLGFSRLGTKNGRRRIAEATRLREEAAQKLQSVERAMATPQPGCS